MDLSEFIGKKFKYGSPTTGLSSWTAEAKWVGSNTQTLVDSVGALV